MPSRVDCGTVSHRSRIAAVVLAGVVALAACADDEDGSPSTSADLGTTTSAETTTGTGASDLDEANLPKTGVAVERTDGTVAIYALDGERLGTIPRPGSGADLRPEAILRLGAGLEPDDLRAVEVPEGCSSARVAGGTRVAVCGGTGPSDADRIDLVDSAGRHTVLVDGSLQPDSDLGHWRWAIPSPDGAWVLAQWSGECEVPYAWLVSVGTRTPRPIGGPLGEELSGSLTEALGWTPDGRMIVRFRSGGCGPEIPDAGTYLVETSALHRTLVVAEGESSDVVYSWRRHGFGNALEALIDRAGDSLPLEGCCGEPSHGGTGATVGWTFEGVEIPVLGFPTGDPLAATGPREHRREVPFAHGAAAVFESGSETVVELVCGAHTWRIGWHALAQPDLDAMLRLGETILPHLGCTLRDPPPA